MKYVAMMSGGTTSWAAAKRLAERHGTGDLTLLFADVKGEDEDTYRFLEEGAANIGLPVTRVADGRTVWEVFHEEGMIGNTRIDLCSRILKRQLLRAWLKENCDPEHTRPVRRRCGLLVHERRGGRLSLYCPACDDVHTVRPGDVERIVYGLYDRLVAEGRRASAEVKRSSFSLADNYTKSFPCLLDVLERTQFYPDGMEGGQMETVQHWVSKRRAG